MGASVSPEFHDIAGDIRGQIRRDIAPLHLSTWKTQTVRTMIDDIDDISIEIIWTFDPSQLRFRLLSIQGERLGYGVRLLRGMGLGGASFL